MAPRHRIAWKSKVTGETRQGNWFDRSTDLAPVVANMNRVYPWLHHWIEIEPSWAEVDTSTEDTEIVAKPDDPTPEPRCQDCGTTENLTYGPCPYDSEINDDYTPVWLCPECYGTRSGDI